MKLDYQDNPIDTLERMMNEMGKEQFGFEEFLKRAEKKDIEPLIVEKLFEQKMLEGEIILKPKKMYQNIP